MATFALRDIINYQEKRKMKKTLLLLAVLQPMVALAQLKVNLTGRVTIGDDDNFYYPLTVTGTSSGEYTANFNGYKFYNI